jgi:hypothetical protein
MEENNSNPQDYSLMTYAEWVRFLFEEELKKSEDDFPFHKYDIEDHPRRPDVLLGYITRLCRELPELVKKYSMKHIGHGLWQAICSCDSPRINQLLWNPDLPLDDRLDCIRSMKVVFTDVVAHYPPEEEMAPVFAMWWDDVCVYRDSADYKDYRGDNSKEIYRKMLSAFSSKTPLNPEDLQRIHETIKEWRKEEIPSELVYKTLVLPILMDKGDWTDAERLQKIHGLQPLLGAELNYDFWDWTEDEIREFREQDQLLIETEFQMLKEILAIGDPWCEEFVLHGLGHLMHPEKPPLIQKFIDRHHETLDADSLEWLEQCRDGSIM